MACEGIHASLAKKAYGFICQSSALLEVISVLHKHGRVLSQRLSERGRSMPDTVYVGLASRISRLEHTRPCWLGRGGGGAHWTKGRGCACTDVAARPLARPEKHIAFL